MQNVLMLKQVVRMGVAVVNVASADILFIDYILIHFCLWLIMRWTGRGGGRNLSIAGSVWKLTNASKRTPTGK